MGFDDWLERKLVDRAPACVSKQRVNEPLQVAAGRGGFNELSAEIGWCSEDRRLQHLRLMRVLTGVLALTLFAPLLRAEGNDGAEPRPPAEATRAKIPLRVVRVMPESHQALLFDRARATHVLAEVGGKVAGYAVVDIDDDEVTLSLDGTQFVLVVPDRGGGQRDRDEPAVHARSAADAPAAAPPPAAPPREIEPAADGVRAPVAAVAAPTAASASTVTSPSTAASTPAASRWTGWRRSATPSPTR